MKKLITTLMFVAMAVMSAGAARHWVGGDISLLPEYEKAGAQYKDHEGKPIAELLPKKVGGQAVLGRQFNGATPWLTERHGYDPT